MRRAILGLVLLIVLVLPPAARADDRLVRLHAPQALQDSGLFRHILPRFTLKTQVRVELVGDADSADLVLGDTGQALFSGLGATWRLSVHSAAHPGTTKFADWLSGEIGRNTVLSFAPEGAALFTEPQQVAATVAEVRFDGDAALGLTVSREKCVRCHKVEPGSRAMTLGSTPSFPVLRSLPDWESRFAAFYVLNPHPAFTQVEDVTEPFDQSRPSPIVPITLTLDEVEAVLAYVAGLAAADLGAPVVHQ